MSYLREVGQSRPQYNKDKGKMARSRSRTSRRLAKWLLRGLLVAVDVSLEVLAEGGELLVGVL